jgi:hypothetical protein
MHSADAVLDVMPQLSADVQHSADSAALTAAAAGGGMVSVCGRVRACVWLGDAYTDTGAHAQTLAPAGIASVFVKTLTGKTVTLSALQPHSTVADLKEKLVCVCVCVCHTVSRLINGDWCTMACCLTTHRRWQLHTSSARHTRCV